MIVLVEGWKFGVLSIIWWMVDSMVDNFVLSWFVIVNKFLEESDFYRFLG